MTTVSVIEKRACGSCAFFKTTKCRNSNNQDLILASDEATQCPDFEFRRRFQRLTTPAVEGVATLIPEIPSPEPYGDVGQLYLDVLSYLRDHVILGDETDYGLVASEVLMTWKIEQANTAPYLLVLCPKGHGKTRLGEVLWQICYRAIPGSYATRAALMRLYDGEPNLTLILDEAEHYLEPFKPTDITALLNAGYRRGMKMIVVDEVLEEDDQGRKRSVRKPVAREAFGPKIIMGRTNVFDTIEDRAFEINMPKGFPKNREIDLERAKALRAKLNYFRLNQTPFPYGPFPDYIEPRLEELANVLLSVTPPYYQENIREAVFREVRQRMERILETLEAKLLSVIRELLADSAILQEVERLGIIETSLIADRYNLKHCDDKLRIRPLSVDRIAKTLSKLRLERLRVRDGAQLKRGFKYDTARLERLYSDFYLNVEESVPPVPAVPAERSLPLGQHEAPLSSINGGTPGTGGTISQPPITDQTPISPAKEASI